MAMFLAHWDNKPENQRLICLSGPPGRDGRCARPLAMLQDVGGTFGPRKVDLDGWRDAPIWKDRAACTVSMETLPHDGATFVTAIISEAGRQFLADRLSRLRDSQIEALFRGARFDQHDGAARRMDRDVQVAGRRDREWPGVRASDCLPPSAFVPQHAGIDRHAAARNRLEVQRVVGDLDEHEVEVVVEAPRDGGGLRAVTAAQRAGAAGDEDCTPCRRRLR